MALQKSLKYAYEIDFDDPQATAPKILRKVGEGRRVLELGAATGSMTKILKERLSCRVVAIELDPQAAELAAVYSEQTIVGDIEQLDLASKLQGEVFDVILAADVLEHLKDPTACLAALKPLLAADGHLVVSVPNVGFSGVVGALLTGSFPYQDKGILDRTHLRFFTRRELEIMLFTAGFVPEVWDVATMVPEGCEFADRWGELPPELQAQLMSAEDGNVYQFIVRARPSSTIAWEAYTEQRFVREQGLKKQIAVRDIQVAEGHAREQSLRADLERQQAMNSRLTVLQAEYAASQAAVFASSSWRLTAPLRWLGMRRNSLRSVLRAYRHCREVGMSCREIFSKSCVLLRQEGLRGLKGRVVKTLRKTELMNQKAPSYAEWLLRYDTLDAATRKVMHEWCAMAKIRPKISILMPVYNCPANYLRAAIESVLAQIYPVWELCIADDASTASHVREILEHYATIDERIRICYRETNGHISAASNSALALATGDYVALFDHDDLLAEQALYWVARELEACPEAALIYSDEDKIGDNGQRSDPHFKPDWNPDLLRSQNYLCHLTVYRRALVDQVGGFRLGYEGSQDYDLALRVSEQLDPARIRHIPRILYHWRMHPESMAGNPQSKRYTAEAALKALNEHLQRRGLAGGVEGIFEGYRVHWQLPSPPPLVSILIPTRNGVGLLRTCVESIVTRSSYPCYEIIVIDNGSDEPATLRYLAELEQRPTCQVLRDPSPFNYSQLNNRAAKLARGEVLALLNNDIEVITPNWLEEMVGFAIRTDVGAVGARLWYPDDTLQHGGVLLVGGVAGHAHPRLAKDDYGYFFRARLAHNLTAVTAACLVVEKSKYLELAGLDEQLAVAFNDVDFCLRLHHAGYRNVWTPFADLYHHESATRGYETTPAKRARFQSEINFMKKRWGDFLLRDPNYNPNFSLDSSDFQLAFPPRLPEFLGREL